MDVSARPTAIHIELSVEGTSIVHSITFPDVHEWSMPMPPPRTSWRVEPDDEDDVVEVVVGGGVSKAVVVVVLVVVVEVEGLVVVVDVVVGVLVVVVDCDVATAVVVGPLMR